MEYTKWKRILRNWLIDLNEKVFRECVGVFIQIELLDNYFCYSVL